MQRKCILWIEDEPHLIGFTARQEMLQDKGYIVELASGVTDAKQLLERGHYDLVLLDIMMPTEGYFSEEEVKGGYETGLALMGMIRGIYPDIPVIIITGYPDPVVENEFRERFHVSHYLMKPISQVELERAIEEEIGVGEL